MLYLDPECRVPLGTLHDLQARIADKPEYRDLINCGVAARIGGELALAEECLQKAHLIKPDGLEVWANLGIVLTDLGRFDAAAEAYSRAARVAKVTGAEAWVAKNIALGYAESLMRLGRFREAWPLWEQGRRNASWHAKLGTQVWDGSPNKKVIVIPEGGYGDAFLFRRWLPALAEVSARVTLAVWPALLDFCDWRQFGADRVISSKDLIFDASDHDADEVSTSWMSLPGLLGMSSWERVPKDPLQGEGRRRTGVARIGYCWRAEENSSLRRIRTLDPATYKQLAGALTHAGCVFSLVPDGKELFESNQPKFPALPYVLPPEHKLDTWRDTLETIQRLDLVVTVDTAVAHLAGIAGTQTILLLPARSDWKWGMPGQPERWYGPHMHLVRNQDPLRWDVLPEVQQKLDAITRGANLPSA